MVKMDDLKQLRDVFVSFDLDGNGTINCRELGRCMEKLGMYKDAVVIFEIYSHYFNCRELGRCMEVCVGGLLRITI